MYIAKIESLMELRIDYAYDDESRDILMNDQQRIIFENALNGLITEFYDKNHDLISCANLKIKVDVNKKGGQIAIGEIAEDSFTLLINLIKLKDSGTDVARLISENISPSSWFMFTNWYGKSSTLLNFVEHEIRHFIDKDRKTLEGYQQKRAEQGHVGREQELLRAIDQIRSEAYPKLFDSQGSIVFSKKKIVAIKENIARYINYESISEEFAHRKDWFLGLLDVGDHHYYIARFMAFMIAYSKMDMQVVIDKENGLKVGNMSLILERELAIDQPPKNIKDIAGNIIHNSNPFSFINEFDKACKVLHIDEDSRPISIKIFKQLRKKCIENLKIIDDKRYSALVEKWKAKEITFAQLKEQIISRSS